MDGEDRMPGWWERGALHGPAAHSAAHSSAAAEQGGASCSYSTFASTLCRVEYEEGGRPVRKCTRLLKKLRDCGRGPEVIEMETVELADNSPLEEADRHPAASTSGAPLDASVGEALEEFLQYAQQLKQRAAGGGSDRVELDPTRLPALSRPYTEPPAQRPWRGLFASLFAREAQCSPGRARPKEKASWEEFAKDFKEV